jgi:hypothetical protein
LAAASLGIDETLQDQFLRTCFYSAVFILVFVGIVFATYQGKTFDFGGQAGQRLPGVGLSWVSWSV